MARAKETFWQRQAARAILVPLFLWLLAVHSIVRPALAAIGAASARLLTSASPKRKPWAALLLSLALHGLALALLILPFAAPEPLAAGEEAMEVEMVSVEATPAAPPVETPPEMEAATPAPEAAQIAAKTPEERLKPEETEGESEAKPPAPAARQAETTAVALAAAAPPPATEAQHAAASSAYRARLARHLARFKRFPGAARRDQSAGQVVMRFTIDRAGRVLSTHIERSSSVEAFDREARDMIQRAQPYPAPPESGAESFSFTIPVSYRLRG